MCPCYYAATVTNLTIVLLSLPSEEVLGVPFCRIIQDVLLNHIEWVWSRIDWKLIIQYSQRKCLWISIKKDLVSERNLFRDDHVTFVEIISFRCLYSLLPLCNLRFLPYSYKRIFEIHFFSNRETSSLYVAFTIVF